MRFLLNLALGLLFGMGLVVSGMSDPAKVLNFLDPLGTWDPSLGFVMAGAVLVVFFGYRVVLAGAAPIFGGHFYLTTRTEIDGRIIVGSAIFEIGWGLGGFCPGPASYHLGPGRKRHPGVCPVNDPGNVGWRACWPKALKGGRVLQRSSRGLGTGHAVRTTLRRSSRGSCPASQPRPLSLGLTDNASARSHCRRHIPCRLSVSGEVTCFCG